MVWWCILCNVYSIKILLYHGRYIHVVSVMLQGRVHPKMKQKLRYFWWILRTFWPSIDSNETGTHFKAQKRSKDIVKIVHVTSLVQPEFYETTRILSVHKENKNNDFIQKKIHISVSLSNTFTTVSQHTSFTNSLCLERGSSVAVYAGSEITLS